MRFRNTCCRINQAAPIHTGKNELSIYQEWKKRRPLTMLYIKVFHYRLYVAQRKRKHLFFPIICGYFIGRNKQRYLIFPIQCIKRFIVYFFIPCLRGIAPDNDAVCIFRYYFCTKYSMQRACCKKYHQTLPHFITSFLLFSIFPVLPYASSHLFAKSFNVGIGVCWAFFAESQ